MITKRSNWSLSKMPNILVSFVDLPFQSLLTTVKRKFVLCYWLSGHERQCSPWLFLTFPFSIVRVLLVFQSPFPQSRRGGDDGNWGWGRVGEVLAETPAVLPRSSPTQVWWGLLLGKRPMEPPLPQFHATECPVHSATHPEKHKGIWGKVGEASWASNFWWPQ